ncbi:MAG: hypothetical protein U0163_12175 [Gemmatimonadaceae bacterium]
MNISGLSSALAALQRGSAAVDRAASRVASVGLTDPESSAAASTVESGAQDDMASANVDLIVSTHMFMAAVRLAQTTNENVLAALRLGGYSADATA